MIIAVAAILVGCKGKGTRVQISDSVDKFKVEKLFVVDSITVYRFYDNGNAIYFTNRKGRVDATHSEYNPVTHTYNGVWHEVKDKQFKTKPKADAWARKNLV